MQLHGIHHLTAVSADAKGNHDFYTRILGMRMVKKTVNQDDVSAYHLFYADGEASPGTDLTFFDWPAAREVRGTNSVVRTALRVNGAATLDWWAARLDAHNVPHGPVTTVDGRLELTFEDPEGQRLALIDDGGVGPAHPWARSPVPAEHQIRGLGPITMSVARADQSDAFATKVMAMRLDREVTGADGVVTRVYAMGEGGPAAELHMRVEPGLSRHQPGAGSVHHVAFRVRDDEYDYWVQRFESFGLRSSGPVDRFYFRSLYVREPSGILYEIATDGPGFATDEAPDALGETLSLPPFLEHRRAEIERGLKPI
ncbi:ring-cleaving dioxygenase [Roseomonas haemaphysalidis]|uniref:Ring-cleaving dioxygenase n=1 Tax=Roseomonas haemaphysalidis TaxID=2768162 RepID=A0ABS3KS15_9PROT|nr:ring-cleaving dioxygenase [Roseomonas haemaphysalidis]MBO1080224.1 ring-cleaving dioxygenase [Roseomonas haemaphysalidis]